MKNTRILVRSFVIAFLVCCFPSQSQAQPLPLCSENSQSICEIRFDEVVSGVPLEIFQNQIGLQLLPNGDVLVPRTAIVWPSDGTLTAPPVLLFFGGHGSTALGSAATMQFEQLWPEAIIVYAQASRLVDHDGKWVEFTNPSFGDTDWSPRFAANVDSSDHTDLPYLDEVLARLGALYPHNQSKMYVSGHSSGGFFSFALNRLRREKFAGFAVIGSFAKYGNTDDVVAGGAIAPARPVLLMLGEQEDVFEWRPAISAQQGGSFHPRRSIIQLAAINGVNAPDVATLDSQIEQLVNDVKASVPAEQYKQISFGPTSKRVMFGVYGGDHSVPPKDAADSSLSGAEWIVEFFWDLANSVTFTGEHAAPRDRGDANSRPAVLLPRDVDRPRRCRILCVGCPMHCE